MTGGYACQLMPDEPILIITLGEDFSVATDGPALIAEMKQIFDSATEPVYLIDDMLYMKITFSDLVAAMAMGTRGDTGVIRHPNLRKLVALTNNELIRFGSTALKQTQYGVSNVDVYGSLQEALAAIRAELAAAKVAAKA